MKKQTLAVALAVFGATAAAAYAIARFVQVAFFPQPDPRLVLNVTRIGFFWRASIAFYAALLAAIGVAALRTRHPRVDRALVPFVLLCAAIAIVQGVFVP